MSNIQKGLFLIVFTASFPLTLPFLINTCTQRKIHERCHCCSLLLIVRAELAANFYAYKCIKTTGFVKILFTVCLMLSSNQLLLESFRTSQEMLFSQAFNHPSSVTASASYLIPTRVRYQNKRRFLSLRIWNNAEFCFYCWIPLTAVVGSCQKALFLFFLILLFPSLSHTNKEWINRR